MTPIIKWGTEFASVGGKYDLTQFHWFDATNVMADYFYSPTVEDLHTSLAVPMPFKQTMICVAVDNKKVVIRAEESETSDGLVCTIGAMGQNPDGSVKRICVFAITKKDGKAQFVNLQEEIATKKEIEHISLVIAKLLDRLKTDTVQVFQPYIKNSFINQKRIKKGKLPLFEWRTVTIEPKIVVSTSHGGSHASPRLHDRRGHWRTMKKSGKRVWVRECKVGDPSKGVIYHDYRFSRQTI